MFAEPLSMVPCDSNKFLNHASNISLQSPSSYTGYIGGGGVISRKTTRLNSVEFRCTIFTISRRFILYGLTVNGSWNWVIDCISSYYFYLAGGY